MKFSNVLLVLGILVLILASITRIDNMYMKNQIENKLSNNKIFSKKKLDPFEQAKALGKGINLGNIFEVPAKENWGLDYKEDYFRIIKSAGFNTVRVPIIWSSFSQSKEPFTIKEDFFKKIDKVISGIEKYGMNVVIDFHNYYKLSENPEQNAKRFIVLWQQIVTRYKNKNENLYYELINEPNGYLERNTLNELYKETIKEIRKIDSFHTIIVSPGEWGNVNALKFLKLPEDEDNLIVTFHMYEPLFFTHAGASYAEEYYHTKNVTWPGPPEKKVTPIKKLLKYKYVVDWFEDYNNLPYEENPAGPKPIISKLDKAKNWSKDNDVPVWLGEFGTYKGVDYKSRVRYTKFVVDELDKRNIPWAYWDFAANCSVFDLKTYKWDDDLLKSLNLSN